MPVVIINANQKKKKKHTQKKPKTIDSGLNPKPKNACI